MLAHERIRELEEQIKLLPQGTLVYKKINGKEQPYLQWNEAGRTRSKYIKVGEREFILAQIAKRKALTEELRQLRVEAVASTPKRQQVNYDELLDELNALRQFVAEKKNSYKDGLKLRAVRNKQLAAFVQEVASWKRRRCFVKLEKFLRGKTEDRICVLYGLRRTGKTTLLKQLIANLDEEDLKRAVYIKCRATDTLEALNEDLNFLQEHGYRYVFIDEVTLLKDFIDGAALLSDIYSAMGMKLVVSGTDSLGFMLASYHELYDRCYLIHTTFIPFYEYVELLGLNDVDTYLRYGGTLRLGDAGSYRDDASFKDDESARIYIDTAICNNIQHSLSCCREGRYFRHLEELYRAGELTNAINRVVEDMNHRFVASVIEKIFKSHDLGSLKQLIAKDISIVNRMDILRSIHTDEITTALMELLDIRYRLQIKLKDVHVSELEEYLYLLDMIAKLKLETMSMGKPVMEYTIFTQPGLRYCQAKALVEAVLKSERFSVLTSKEREYVEQRILEDVSGRMLEDMILFETNRAKSRHMVVKLQFAVGEIDMLIYDYKTDTCELYEIKHSKQQNVQQYRYLIDTDILQQIEHRFGTIVKRCVLYRGEAMLLENGIVYENVNQYLVELGK